MSARRRPPGRVGSETCLQQTSSRLILAVDRSKLGTRAQARMFELDEVDLLVTELDPDDGRLDPFRASVELL